MPDPTFKPSDDTEQGHQDYENWLNETTRQQETETRLVQTIKTLIEKGEKAKQKAEDFYIAAGQYLKTLHDIHKGRGGTWPGWEILVKEKCGIGKSRASELMRIADGRTTTEAVQNSQGGGHEAGEGILSATWRRNSRSCRPSRRTASGGWSDERYRRHRHARTEGLAVPLAGARKTVEILTESEESEIGSQSAGEIGTGLQNPIEAVLEGMFEDAVKADAEGGDLPNRLGELARLSARVDELENALRQRDIKIAGLESEVVELEAARASECPDVKAAAEIIEANFDQFIAAMSPTLRAKLERKVRAEKNGGDGDIDPDRTITRMLQDAIACAVAAEDPNTEPGGAVAESNRAKAQKLLRDTDRKVRSRGFVRST